MTGKEVTTGRESEGTGAKETPITVKLSHSFLPILIMVMTMITSATPIKENPPISNRSNRSIPALKAEVERLRGAPRSWQKRYLWLVGFTLLVGAGMLISQYMQSRAAFDLEAAQSELSTEQESLSAERDREVAGNLKAKDVQIAELTKATADAGERAARAESHLADANARASEADARAKQAEAQVAKANAASHEAVAKVADADARIAEANRAAAEANRIAESERLARIRIEERLSDRVLTTEQYSMIVSGLSRIPKFRVQFMSLAANKEAERFAEKLITAFGPNGAKWDIDKHLSA